MAGAYGNYVPPRSGQVAGPTGYGTPLPGYGAPQGQAGYRPEAIYGEKRKQQLPTNFSSDHVFTWTSILLLTTLMVIPVWNACALLTDENYVYWAGRTVPAVMISACIGIITVYVVTMLLFFRWARPSVRIEQTVMMIVNMFITLLGLTLMLVSLPLSRQAADTYIALTHRCDYDDLTHRTFEYWTVLHNIRSQTDCASLSSVEECDGFEPALPYTSFLKTLENDFRCSGFCWKPPPASLADDADAGSAAPAAAAASDAGTDVTATAGDQTPVTAAATTTAAPAAGGTNLMAIRPHAHTHASVKHRRHHMLSFLQEGTHDAPSSPFPPSLFSHNLAQASCEGMAGRDMRNFAGDIGYQTFYQGIYLVVIAIITGFLKLIGACLARDTAVPEK
jgi:hypothetical protein